MQTETRHVHVSGSPGGIEPRRNVAQFDDVLENNASWIVVFIKASQSPVTDRPDL
jgi:hypothetical protein